VITDTNNDKANFAGCIVRTAGHDFMDFRTNNGVETGGSDGCINFKDPDNNGLPQCLQKWNINKIYENFCTEVSLADFLVIAAEAIMGNQASNADLVNYYKPGNLAWYFRRDFKAGRTTAETCPSSDFLMPNPELGCVGLKSIFIDHIYKASTEPWILTAAISGAHTLGSAKISNSGYNGFWSDVQNAHLFNNDYFISLVAKGWGPELAVGGNAGKT
jgi:hypothetical protein